MRRTLLAAALTLLAAPAAVADGPGTSLDRTYTAPADWMQVTLANAAAHEVVGDLDLATRFTGRADGPGLVGVGTTGLAAPADVVVFRLGGSPRVSTTQAVGGLDVRVRGTGSERGGVGFGGRPRIPAHGALRLLVFAPEGRLTRTTGSFSRPGLRLSVRSGTGSGWRSFTGPGAGGVGASTVAADAASSRVSAVVPTGITGSVVRCSACGGSWTPPAGPSRLWGLDGDTTPVFAGPAGRWSWTWQGATVIGGGAVMAWAPTGADTPSWSGRLPEPS